MMCYKDKTFCPFWANCQDADKCGRALTTHVEKEAEKAGLWIAKYMDKIGE